MVNLHHGRIPDYRGGPAAFWEIYNEERAIGVSVHRMDAQLDHGELLGAAEVALEPGDDQRAAMERLYAVDFQVMGDVVAALANGTSNGIAVDFNGATGANAAVARPAAGARGATRAAGSPRRVPQGPPAGAARGPGMSGAVAFVQRRVPHYREAFFAGLYEHLGERGISLDVMVAGGEANGAPVPRDAPAWLSAIGARRLAVKGREVIWQDVLRATASHDLVITELSPRIVSNLALVARSRLGGPLVGGFGHGRNFMSTHTPGPRSAHARLVRSIDWWFAYNDLSREAVMSFGVPPARITAVNNTIDTKQLTDAVAAHRRDGVDELRRSLGIAGAPVAIFCGSLYARKRLDFVFDAALRLRRTFPEPGARRARRRAVRSRRAGVRRRPRVGALRRARRRRRAGAGTLPSRTSC